MEGGFSEPGYVAAELGSAIEALGAARASVMQVLKHAAGGAHDDASAAIRAIDEASSAASDVREAALRAAEGK